MTDIRPPKDGVRAMPPGSLTGDGRTLIGRLAPVNEWAEIRSIREGHFMERHAKGAFAKTFAENRDRIKILFQHGKDPQLGDRMIAAPQEFGEDEEGPFYRAEILDGLDPLIVDGLQRGLYGSSHTFQVVKEDPIVYPKEPTAWNPDRLPERTIREVRVMEMGPVTWPAYLGSATAARSMTDEFALADLTADPARLAELVDHIEPVALPVEAAAEPHSEPVSRAAVVPTPETKESTTVEYVTRDEKAARITELEAALERQATEWPGVMPADVQAKFDADLEERKSLERDVAAWDDRQAKLAAFASRTQNLSPTYEAPTIVRRIDDIYDMAAIRSETRSREEYDQRVRDNAMRSLESSRIPKTANIDAIADTIDRNDSGEEGNGEIGRRILLTGSPTYQRAFNKYLRGESALWSPEEARAAALAVTGTTTTGGYAVPYVFDPTLIHIGAHTSINPYRAACRVETITNGNNWRAVTVGAVTAAWNAEAAAETEQGPTFGQPTFTVQRASAFATVSLETLQDRPDIGSELSSVFGEAKDTLEENSFTLGAGTTVYPQGMFLSGAFTVVSTATNDVTAISDTQLVEAALPLRHRMNAAWFMSRSTQRQLEALDTTGYYFKRPGQIAIPLGMPVPGNSPTGNTGTQLLGYPIWEVPSAASTLTTDAAVIAVLGDPRNYVIVDRVGMSVEVIQNMLNGATPSFPTGQRGIFCYWRSTARALNVDGMRQLDVN